MRVWVLLALLIIFPASAYAAAMPTGRQASTCNSALAGSLKDSVISIERVLPASEQTVTSRGGLGTGWFVSDTRLVTIGHVVTAQKLSRSWKKVTLRWSDKLGQSWKYSLRTEVRIVETVPTGMVEPLVIIEIKDPIPWAHVPKIRKEPLKNNERVIGIAYEGYLKENTVVLIYGMGVVVSSRSINRQIPLRMTDKNGHFRTFDGGTSGGPLFDCNGEVVGVMQAKKSGRINNFAVSPAPLLRHITQSHN